MAQKREAKTDLGLSTADLEKVTRLEVIGNERELVRWNIEIRGTLLQDEGRTLKVVIRDRSDDNSDFGLQGKDN
ncbi:MAG: hypothetical protein ACP5DX_00940 [Paracoccaceae bacterium]